MPTDQIRGQAKGQLTAGKSTKCEIASPPRVTVPLQKSPTRGLWGNVDEHTAQRWKALDVGGARERAFDDHHATRPDLQACGGGVAVPGRRRPGGSDRLVLAATAAATEAADAGCGKEGAATTGAGA